MYSRVKDVFIGGAVTRYPTTGSGLFTTAAGTVTTGGIYILDKDKKIMTAGQTVSDTDTIYIAEVLSSTITGTNEAGTAFTYKRILMSDPIRGAYVRNYSRKAYSAKVEQVVTVYHMSQTPVVGDEYVLRIVYKDVKEHPGQKTHTYRVICNSATIGKIYNQLAAAINGDPKSRVVATASANSATDFTTAGDLILTGKPIPECTTGVDDIDEFQMVNFEVFFYWIDQTASTYKGLGPFQSVTLSTAITYTTAVSYGNGTWEQVRDAEKSVLAQQLGVTNRIWFPIKKPTARTSASLNYNTIIIDFDDMIQTPDNGYQKLVKKSAVIYIPTTTADYEASILSVLNGWMASTPKALAAIVV